MRVGRKVLVSIMSSKEARARIRNKLTLRRWRHCAGAAAAFWLAVATQGRCGEVFSIPLDRTNGWQLLNYRKISPNTFRVSPNGLEIGVTNSAAPAVFPLPGPIQVKELRVNGKITGTLKMPPGKQGEKGFDDYVMRVGLVESGSRTLTRGAWMCCKESSGAGLGWSALAARAANCSRPMPMSTSGSNVANRSSSPTAPRGTGISGIHFFNVGTDRKQVGRSRTHPLSDLMEETIVAVPDATGRFIFNHQFAQPLRVLAVWIASDGDDTKSSFAVALNEVQLEGPPAPGTQ